MKLSRSEFIRIRNYQYHCRHWGRVGAPMIIMVHGWMDVSISFQFVVDALQQDWHIIAPDLRGFGLTKGPQTDTFWVPDYLADLDAILDYYSPNRPVYLLGHSLGGNIVGLYAGVRPEKIKQLAILEGFGLPQTSPSEAPLRYQKWLDALQSPARMRTYASLEEVALRLQKNNPRLEGIRALFLAQHWAQQNDTGRWEILGDPAHKRVQPILYRLEEVLACWERITAPVLWVEGAETAIWTRLGGKAIAQPEVSRRLSYIKNVECVILPEAGHMLHHDQPALLAQSIETFFKRSFDDKAI